MPGRRRGCHVQRIGPVEMDVARHVARVRGAQVDLPPKEFALLKALLLGHGRLRTRAISSRRSGGQDSFGDTKTLDVHVKRLRQKIESEPHNPEHLVTVRGLGYRFLDHPQNSADGAGALVMTAVRKQPVR